VQLCVIHCEINWDSSGKFVYISFPSLIEGSYLLPVLHDVGLPKIPSAPIAGIDEFKNTKAIVAIPWVVGSALSPSVYAYIRESTRRNLYRLQLQ
jgi:hypothetical protein